MKFTDAHFHMIPLALNILGKDISDFNWAEKNISELEKVLEQHLISEIKNGGTFYGLSCALDKTEFEIQKNLCKNLNKNSLIKIETSFGLHPEITVKNPEKIAENLEFLEKCLLNDEIFAIGEIGFDFFSEELKMSKNLQTQIFSKQLELALRFQKPVVFHIRKGIDEIFNEIKGNDRLKKIPKVIFHNWSGSKSQAESLIKKGINAYFSFGKNLRLCAKNAVKCYETLGNVIGEERIFEETDSPF